VRFRDAIALAVRGVLRRPGRAALTVMAVALAAALLVALLTIARTAETRVLGQLSKGGPLAGIKVAAAAPDPTALDTDDPRPGQSKDLGEDAVDRIRALPNVRSVVRIVGAREVVTIADPLKLADGRAVHPQVRERDPRGVLFEDVVGIDLRQSSKLPLTIIAGRLPLPGSTTEVAVTPAHLSRLGLSKADAALLVGTELEAGSARVEGSRRQRVFRVRWTKQTVVGVVAQEAADGDIVASMESTRAARVWSASGDDGGEAVGLKTSPYTGLFVVAGGLDQVAPVRAAIDRIGYSTSAPENLVASVQRYLHVVEIVLAGIGAIALLIASLGITNALLAAIRERRREIGVLKAIGARDRDVLRVFLLEAGMLGFLGGILGAALGVAIAMGVGAVVNAYLTSEGLAGTHVGVPTLIALGAVAGATVLAVVAGAVPAWRAAKLPAREAVDA
jgi:cell division protein FtsX